MCFKSDHSRLNHLLTSGNGLPIQIFGAACLTRWFALLVRRVVRKCLRFPDWAQRFLDLEKRPSFHFESWILSLIPHGFITAQWLPYLKSARTTFRNRVYGMSSIVCFAYWRKKQNFWRSTRSISWLLGLGYYAYLLLSCQTIAF